ncbi:hypothetical protein GCM10027347_59640 [Larkinella harenae]
MASTEKTGERLICSSGGYSDNRINGEVLLQENEANAEFIVHACNSYYDLIETLEKAHVRMKNAAIVYKDRIPDRYQWEEWADECAKAIAKAKGNTQ